MNITKQQAQRTLLVLLTILLAACSPQDKTNTTVGDQNPRTFQCIAQQSQCQFDLAEGQVQVLFDVGKIVAEQAFNMVLNYKGEQTIASISGYLEGDDMFMGKIPLFIEANSSGSFLNDKALSNLPSVESDVVQFKIDIKTDNNEKRKTDIKQVFQAEVLVGSCSAQQMTWRIWLTFTMSDNKTYTKMLTVMSYRI